MAVLGNSATIKKIIQCFIFAAAAVLLCGCSPIEMIENYLNAQQSPIAEESSAVESEPQTSRVKEKGKYDDYGMAAYSKISLKFGDNIEKLDITTTSEWIILKPFGKDVYTYVIDEAAIADYAKQLAEKYNTFSPYMDFTTHYGETISAENKCTGWIFDEVYAVQQLSDLILDGREVSLDLTDGSEESNKWWTRFMGKYKDDTGYGKSYAEVSIGNQYMWLVIDGKTVLESPVVTGNPNTGNDTPKGFYLVTNKQSPATLYGETYVTEVSYWVGFTYQIGFHDAEWQESFGGDVYYQNGSHGCVNVPTYVAEEIYEKAFVDMPVFVY